MLVAICASFGIACGYVVIQKRLRRPVACGPPARARPAAPALCTISTTSLLRSPIWDLNTQFYSGAAGSVNPDTNGGSVLEVVPDWPSNHPKLAKALVRVCVKFLEEATRRRGGRCGADEPCYIVEIGSGSAKLAYESRRWLHDRRPLLAIASRLPPSTTHLQHGAGLPGSPDFARN